MPQKGHTTGDKRKSGKYDSVKNLLLCHVVSLARQVNADFFKAFPEPLCLNITGVKVD